MTSIFLELITPFARCRTSAQILSVLVAAPLVIAVVGGSASAGTVSESEPNDNFASRQIVGRATSQVDAEIADLITFRDFELFSNLVAGAVNGQFVQMVEPEEAMPGDPFIAWIDNVPGAGTPDTLLAVVDNGGSLVSTADEITRGDDASPDGSGTASAVFGVVESDGFIRLEVTGKGDNDFNGTGHTESGDFDLFVSLGKVDVDYFSFVGLIPGEEFEVLMTPLTGATLNLKTLLWLDNDGVPMPPRDDPIFDTLPFEFSGTVPACDVPVFRCGVLNFAVAGGEDTNADGIPDVADAESDPRLGIGAGEYTLLYVPEPSRTASVFAALLVVSSLARRRRRAPTSTA